MIRNFFYEFVGLSSFNTNNLNWLFYHFDLLRSSMFMTSLKIISAVLFRMQQQTQQKKKILSLAFLLKSENIFSVIISMFRDDSIFFPTMMTFLDVFHPSGRWRFTFCRIIVPRKDRKQIRFSFKTKQNSIGVEVDHSIHRKKNSFSLLMPTRRTW